MIHSQKNTWIAIFSLFAMLMSSYVSSMPMMAMNSLPSSYSTAAEKSDTHPHHHSVEYTEMSRDTQTEHSASHCHSQGQPQDDISAYSAMKNTHCGDTSFGGDTCCISVCSSTSFPTSGVDALHTLSFSLALHQSDTIGAPVTRIQTLLRPPSA
ncbi:hypothetical protein F0231_03385 [Vibrio sp. RE86]|uniref:hypothetical protein n=1 Tax=Vibrio sp. RE86 TaxID=2607605 RepID=UPI0014935CAE|nr:hypothetical protein [Vibrio sp. RE86]NOH78780.1 hypothetical protein [Vibrio sp. RE86]